MKRVTRIEGGEIRLTDLLDDAGKVSDLEAVDATIKGPAVVVPLGSTSIQGCSWDAGGGGVDAVLWEIDAARRVVVGAVGLQDCSFRNCRFVNVGYAATQDGIAAFLNGTTV